MELSDNEKKNIIKELNKSFESKNRIIMILYDDTEKSYKGIYDYSIEDKKFKNGFVNQIMKFGIKLGQK